MYQSLLPTLKPLIFEGKSGILKITHRYNDQAQLFLREGIIEQVETTSLRGKQAAAACARWVSITTEFVEGQSDNYTPDPEIDTNSFLSFVEKIFNTIETINKNIPDNDVILQIDTDKLHKTDKLSAENLKIALLFDGVRNIEQVLLLSGKSELAVLAHTCKLVMAGVANKVTIKNVMPKQDREKFLELLNAKLTDLIGPAGLILVDDAFEKIGSDPETLTREEIPALIAEIGVLLDDKELVELDKWSTTYQKSL